MASLKSIIRQGKQTRSDLKNYVIQVKYAVVYGYGTKNTSVKVDEVEFIKVIREVGRNGVIDLALVLNQSKLWCQIINSTHLKTKLHTSTS